MDKETARLEAFSDGIFGVAITLLAIDIGIKEYEGATNLSLWHDIVERWPEYFAHFNSFAVVLLVWMGHHMILKPVRRANAATTLLNGAVLLLVVLFPFPPAARPLRQLARPVMHALASQTRANVNLEHE